MESEYASPAGVEVEAARGTSPDADMAATVRRRRVRIILASALLFVIVASVAWFLRYQSYGKYQQSTEDAFFQADSVTASARIPGYIDQVLVHDNQEVKAGQPLLRLDVRDYRAQAAQGQAQIDLAAANAANVRAMISEQSAMIRQESAMLAAARQKAAFADTQVARYTPLAATGAEPAEKLAALRDQAAQARQEVASRQAALEIARRHATGLQTQVAQAQAQERGARAQAQATGVNVGSAVVRASVAGRVGDLQARGGQFVQPGQRLMSIVPVQQVYLEANFKETQLGLMRPGQPAHIEADALPGLVIHGHVASVAPGTGAQFSLLPPQNATGNFTKIVQRVPVRIAIDADPALKRLLIPGLSVEVSVDTRSARDEVARLRARQNDYRDSRK